jgi:hypothetical protein
MSKNKKNMQKLKNLITSYAVEPEVSKFGYG